LLLLTLLLQLGYLVFPVWQVRLNPVFAALFLGLAAAFLLGWLSAGQRWLTALEQPPAKQALAFWQQQALRLGIVLFALNISPSTLLSIDPWQLLKLLVLVAAVLTLALWIGRRWFKLPPELVLFVSAGLSFCGTSAIFATHALRSSMQNSSSNTQPPPSRLQNSQSQSRQSHSTQDHSTQYQNAQSAQAYLTQSLAAVMLMGLLALGSYSLILQQQWLGSADLAWLVGSTAPEVSQAVAAGSQLADNAPQAIIAKLSRVCLLLPFLCWLSLQHRRNQPNNDQPAVVVFPWFILAFVVVVLLQLLLTIPDWLQHLASTLSQGCLVFAMLASGLQTKAQDLRQCSYRLFGFAALVLVLLFGLALALLQL